MVPLPLAVPVNLMASNTSAVYIQENPLTPMAFLTPDIGYQATMAAYVMVGSLGVSLQGGRSDLLLINVIRIYRL